MINAQRDAIKLSVSLSIYGRAAKKHLKETAGEDLATLVMYAFQDGVLQTALAFQQVLDGNRTPDEAYSNVVTYADMLGRELRTADENGGVD